MLQGAFLASIIVGWLACVQEAKAQSGSLIREVYFGASGSLDSLTNLPTFPSAPDLTGTLNQFEAPDSFADFYGQRVRAYLIPPVTGNYTFWIESDDQGVLFLSTDDSPANRQLIAYVTQWTDTHQWDKEPNQQSAPVLLQAGKRYYIEALQSEGGGGDHLAVRWQLPDGTIEEPIPGSRFIAEIIPPQVVDNPQNLTVTEGDAAAFTVKLSNVAAVNAQWLRNGAPIPGETNLSLSFFATMADNNASYRVALSNSFGTNISTIARLTVNKDTTPPQIVSAVNPGEPDLVAITFSKPVDATTAGDINNYFIDGLDVLGATVQSDGRSVLLRTSPQGFGGSYTVTVNNILDTVSEPRNMIDPDSQARFTFAYLPLPPEIVFGKPEQIGPSSRRTGLAITEIMYHPATRADGRNLEFVELFNSEETLVSLDGFRLSGAIDFEFPAGAFIGPNSFLVVASAPGDVQTVYGLPRVYGPFSNHLNNGNGTIRLRNDRGAVLLEAKYGSETPWPAAADGAGHSLVLARPSYGEGDPRAWMASAAINGSAGRVEPTIPNPYAGLVINEFLAHSDPPAVDFIELFNMSAAPIDISNCILTDDPAVAKFKVPAATSLPAFGRVVYVQSQLGFGLNASGETAYLISPSKNRVIDAVRFGPQANGVAMGRFPDGNPVFRQLSAPTPGDPNAPVLLPPVVISEIMYHPPSGNDDDEFIELYNRTTNAVSLAGWKMADGVSFTFPANATIAAKSYLVLAKNRTNLLANYPNLSGAIVLGDYNGNLSNGGERIALTRPDSLTQTNGSGATVTTIIDVVENEVTYLDGGRYTQWSDGGGSSLELIDLNSDNTLAANWADSDETKKSQWVTIEAAGLLDNGMTNFAAVNPSQNLHVILEGAGEALLDNVVVLAGTNSTPGTNVVINSDFEKDAANWIWQGTHEDTSLETTEGDASGKSLHIRATGRGDTASNRIQARLAKGMVTGMTGTLRARMRWLKGDPDVLLRLHGNYLEAPGRLSIPKNLGTPGTANSRAVANAGPSIARVTHFPIAPAADTSVRVAAEISDPNRVTLATLNYRIDPGTNVQSVVMTVAGGGFYSAQIPAQGAGVLVAFWIQATDTNGATRRFPADAPARECLVGFGESGMPGTFANYRNWMTASNINRWTVRDRSSNKALDATFAYNNDRVVYNMNEYYSGSPFHWRGYSGPLNSACNYLLQFPGDDLFLGQSDFVLNLPSNLSSDDTALREQTFFWMADQIDQPVNHRRYHHYFLDGQYRGFFEDAQQPNQDMLDEWYPDDPDGDLFKIEDWFEFNSSLAFANRDAILGRYLTTNLVTKLPEPKVARYRWNFRKRAESGTASDYKQLLDLMDALNTTDPDLYTARVKQLVDIDEWMGAVAIRHAVGDWDAYGYTRGKNMYAYKPKDGKWQLMHWDIAFAFGLGHETTHDLFDTNVGGAPGDTVTARMMQHPEFRRAYLRALQRLISGPMVASRVGSFIDAKFAALSANNIGINPPNDVKAWIEERRAFIEAQLGSVSANFAITTPGSATFTTNRNAIDITGTAPVAIDSIAINGVVYPVTWITPTTWKTRITVSASTNKVVLTGLDAEGNPIQGMTTSLTVNYTGAVENEVDRVVINEIQYNPTTPDTAFVELHNTSRTVSFDLSGHHLRGVDYDFPAGTIIGPGGFAVIASNPNAFVAKYGSNLPLLGAYNGKLKNTGETLTLWRYDATGTNEVVVDSVTFDSTAPWSTAANGTGASLQVIDPTIDTTRVFDWAAAAPTPGATNSVRTTLKAPTKVFLNEIQPNNIAGPADTAGEKDPWVELYNPSTGNITLTGLYLTDDLNNLQKWALPAVTIPAKGFTNFWLDGQPEQGANHASFRLSGSGGVLALVGLQTAGPAIYDYLKWTNLIAGRSFGAYPDGQAQFRTAFYINSFGGTNNNTPAPVTLFINEWMASNTRTIADPADGDYDDWFEIYNPNDTAADISGYYLTDTLTDKTKFRVPNGITIPAHGFLLVWADNETQQDNGAGQLHAGFSLSASGEAIGIYTPSGVAVDTVTFGAQSADVSQGRATDGGAGAFVLFNAPSPGTSNAPATGIQVSAANATAGQLTITWNSESGVNYDVQVKNAVTDAWTLLRSVPSAGSSTTITEATSGTTRFFRIAKP